MRFKPRCKAQVTVVLDTRTLGTNVPPFTIDVSPITCSITRNGYHEADTWNMEIDARLLPFDPDSIKQLEARIFMWDETDNGEETNWAVDKFEMIRGLMDEDDGVLIGEDSMIKMNGRDYTGVLLDIEWDPKIKTPNGLPLDKFVQELADQAAPKGTRARFEVSWESTKAVPIVGGVIGKQRHSKKRGQWIKPGKNYWDIIYDTVISEGFITYVKVQGVPLRPTIIITDPKTQIKQQLNAAPRLAYGRHLTKLSVKRKFAREKVPQLIMVTWDPITKKEIEITFPEKRNVVVDVFGTPIAVKKDEQEFVPAPRGIYDRDTLLRYLKTHFYHRGRAETQYTFETPFLNVTQRDEQDIGVQAKSDFDLLRLQPGDAVGVKFDPFNREHLRSLSVGERKEHIISLGYKPTIATVIANNLDTLTAFEQPYYFNKGKFDYDIEQGVDIEITGVNFASATRENKLTGDGF